MSAARSARRRAADRGLAAVRRRLAPVPAAAAVFEACLAGLVALEPLGVVAGGSLARRRARVDRWSDLDLAAVLPDRRRLAAFRRRAPVAVAAAGRVLAAVAGPGAAQWLALLERDGALVKVDLHAVTAAELAALPSWVAVHDPAGALAAPVRGRRQSRPDPVAAAHWLWAAWVRAERGDPLDALSLLGRGRDALLGPTRDRWAALGPAERRRVVATLPRAMTRAELRRAIAATCRLGAGHGRPGGPLASLARLFARAGDCRQPADRVLLPALPHAHPGGRR